jgi:hypothetical protein
LHFNSIVLVAAYLDCVFCIFRVRVEFHLSCSLSLKHGTMASRKHGGTADEKTATLFSSILKEKLDAVAWAIKYSGLPVTATNEQGYTALHFASKEDKPKSLLVILDALRQKRELKDALDAPFEGDEDEAPEERGAGGRKAPSDGKGGQAGMTALMFACRKGAEKCVEHLLFYKASLTAKSAAGLTPLDYAVRMGRKGVEELIRDELGEGTAVAGPDEGVDADGLTSTQRSRLKKRQLAEAAHKSILAAVTAASALHAGGPEGDAADSKPADDAAVASDGLVKLPAVAPKPLWPEIAVVVDEKRRECSATRGTKAAEGAGSVAGGAGDRIVSASAPAVETEGEPGTIDPALWHCSLVNRLELHIPRLGVFSPQIGHLIHLQTLILSGSGITELPESLQHCTDLKFIDISNNSLTTLPSAFGKLTKLEALNAAENKLTSISSLSSLTSLLTILLDKNELTDISALNYAGLSRLDTLSVSYNKLTALPDEIGAVGASLTVLNASNNELVELTSGLADLKEKKLKELKLLPNPIADKKVRVICCNASGKYTYVI